MIDTGHEYRKKKVFKYTLLKLEAHVFCLSPVIRQGRFADQMTKVEL
jgi:hypothetical protein